MPTRELHDKQGVRIVKSVRVDGYVQHRSEDKGIHFSTVDFTGELEIINAIAFRKTLLEGLGHSKALVAACFWYGVWFRFVVLFHLGVKHGLEKLY